MKLLSEKRLQADLSEKWQILSPVSNTWISMNNQEDKWNRRRNKRILKDMQEIFNYDNIKDTLHKLREGLKYPYVSCYASTLGGRDRVSILLIVSEDSRENWNGGILENSRYRKIHIAINGIVENFTSRWNLEKFRKFKGKSIKHIIEKLNKLQGGVGYENRKRKN